MEEVQNKKSNQFIKIFLILNTILLVYLVWKSYQNPCCCNSKNETVVSEINEENNDSSTSSAEVLSENAVVETPIIEEKSEPVTATAAVEKPNATDQEEEDLWANAKDKKTKYSYERYVKLFPNGKHAKEAEKALVDMEVKDLLREKHGKLPPMEAKTPPGGANKSHSNVEIKNDTKHELVVRYSGPESKKITLKSGEKKSFTISNGEYQMTATVSGANVKTYAGHDKLTGMNYYSEFYIP
jgi:hypothetical protein